MIKLVKCILWLTFQWTPIMFGIKRSAVHIPIRGYLINYFRYLLFLFFASAMKVSSMQKIGQAVAIIMIMIFLQGVPNKRFDSSWANGQNLAKIHISLRSVREREREGGERERTPIDERIIKNCLRPLVWSGKRAVLQDFNYIFVQTTIWLKIA